MLPKRITASFWDSAVPCSHLLDVGRTGVDGDQLQKLASGNLKDQLGDIRPEKGFAYVHIVTNGDGAHYSSNTNGDYFNESAMEWTFPEPTRGIQKTASLKGGLKEYHNWTYEKFGGVYSEHCNSKKKDPRTGKPYQKKGDIAKAMYNDRMHRGELILKLPEAPWEPVLQKIARNEPVTWSMACGVPTDICSYCGHRRSATHNVLCDHLKYMLNKTAADGHLICALNDETYYHDISLVDVPAEKIAHTLEKVACGYMVPSASECDAEGLWLPMELIDKLMRSPVNNRMKLKQQLAMVEKDMDCGDSSLLDMAPAFDRDPEEERDLARKLQGIPLDLLLSGAASKKMLLSPRTFTIIVLGKGRKANPALDIASEPPWLDLLPGKLQSLFSSSPLEDLEDGSYVPRCGAVPQSVLTALNGCEDALSLAPTPVTRRVTIKVIRKDNSDSPDDREQKLQECKLKEKEASVTDVRLAEAMAREYAKYQISFLNAVQDDTLVPLVVLQNRQA